VKRLSVERGGLERAATLHARRTKPRAGVVNDDEVGILPLKIIVPITDWKDRYAQAPWMVRLELTPENGLSKTAAADAFQVRSVSEQRFVSRLGSLSPDILDAVGNALMRVLQLPP